MCMRCANHRRTLAAEPLEQRNLLAAAGLCGNGAGIEIGDDGDALEASTAADGAMNLAMTTQVGAGAHTAAKGQLRLQAQEQKISDDCVLAAVREGRQQQLDNGLVVQIHDQQRLRDCENEEPIRDQQRLQDGECEEPIRDRVRAQQLAEEYDGDGQQHRQQQLTNENAERSVVQRADQATQRRSLNDQSQVGRRETYRPTMRSTFGNHDAQLIRAAVQQRVAVEASRAAEAAAPVEFVDGATTANEIGTAKRSTEQQQPQQRQAESITCYGDEQLQLRDRDHAFADLADFHGIGPESLPRLYCNTSA